MDPNASPRSRVDAALRELQDATKLLDNDRSELKQIAATLYVNFVRHDIQGIKLNQDEWDSLGLNGSLLEILKRLEHQIAVLRYSESNTKTTKD